MNDSKIERSSLKTGDSCRWSRYANSAAEKFKRNRNLILLCLIATFAWGMVAHAYVFFHSSFSHDALNEFNAEALGNDWKIQLGRVFVPLYRFLVRSDITLPWLIGVLSLLYISAAVFMVVKIFDISSKYLTVLTAGILTVNITVIAQAATYMNDFDCNMLALALPVAAVYLWKKYERGFLLGIILVCLSLGLYQSYISVTITLILLYLIIRLLDGKTFQDTFRKGLKSVGMLIGGGALYFVSIKVISFATGITLKSGNYNSIDTILSMSLPEIIQTTIYGYFYTCYKLLTALSSYPAVFVGVIHVAMIAIAGLIILRRIFQKEIHVKEKVLTLALIALLPIGMNAVYTLTGGMSHDLMHYAVWLVYLFVLLIGWWAVDHFEMVKPALMHGQLVVLSLLVFIVLWGNVQTANKAYLKKDLEYEANLSLFTRIVYQMECCEEYVTGETSVVFVGRPDSLLDPLPGFEELYEEMTGEWNTYVLGAAGRNYYQAYFDYVLMNPAVIADTDTWNEMQTNSEVDEMPCYPEEGSIAIVDGVLVVKLG